jgi:hypothetical protein
MGREGQDVLHSPKVALVVSYLEDLLQMVWGWLFAGLCTKKVQDIQKGTKGIVL